MTTIPRPNKEALTKVIDIYRDAMQPFLVHHLRQAPGKRVEDAIKQALRDNQANQFEQNLRNGRSVEESIDINDFPELVRAHWRDVFSNRFPGDRVMQNRLYEIKSINCSSSQGTRAAYTRSGCPKAVWTNAYTSGCRIPALGAAC